MPAQKIFKILAICFLLGFGKFSIAQNAADSLAAEFCIYYRDKAWEMAPYRIPKDSILIFSEIGTEYSRWLSIEIDRFNYSLFFLGALGGAQSNYLHPINDTVSIYSNMNITFFDKEIRKEDFPKILKLHWKYTFSVNKKKQTVNNDGWIYISGFCTDEQLAIIRQNAEERKKKR